ncbi:hypothetical protein GCM10027445_21530 [Amycolatopsis endophytica]|uniref:DUF308 domain-containing protein n=1 Tax=Amycolatopsis endophytica TaxID=860233 RepID=A0A853BE71_9PSEU|nr:hypothetical protein [Amycolatopsis endophytica]NYI92951.1 hypothetical protein [Amycolatopsis endophytica]
MTTPPRVLRVSRLLLVAVLLGGPVLGAVAGAGVAPVTGWLTGVFGGAPGPLRLLERVPLPWLIGGGAVVGLVAAALFALTIVAETTAVEITEQGVTVERDGSRTFVARDRIGAVYTDPRDLVLCGHDGRELLRREADVGARRLAEEFEAAGYPWRGTRDPDEDSFRPWADGAPDLPDEVHALLRRRERALRDGKPGAAAELRDRAQELGVVVRDRRSGHRQQWRAVKTR